VSNIIKDKKFRDEVIANIPEELMREDENSEGGEMDLAKFAGILKPAGDAMGYSFTEEELGSEFEKQIKALSTFKKISFFAGFGKALVKRSKTLK
jgi:hypothetical protein